ncbi:hypothetical protein [Pararhizobium sp. A13]
MFARHLDALEFVLLLGVIPAMAIWFIIAFRAAVRADTATVGPRT